MKLLFTGLLACLASSGAYAQSAAGFPGNGLQLRGGAIDFYNGKEPEPALRVRLDKVYTDYERKGFFRIGVLPIGVLEGVTVRLEHPESATNGLAQLHRWLGANGARRLELRRLKFLVSGPTTTQLEVGRGRIAAGGEMELLDGVSFLSATNQVHAARARLQVTGDRAGQLILDAEPSRTITLFSCIQTPKPSNQRNLQ